MPCSISNPSKTTRLSYPCKLRLNGQHINAIIRPPEEAFFCLNVAKNLLAKVISLNEERKTNEEHDKVINLDEFKKPEGGYKVSPFKKGKQNTKLSDDVHWFFQAKNHIDKIFREDFAARKENPQDHWLYMDFSAEIKEVEDAKAAAAEEFHDASEQQDDQGSSGSSGSSTGSAEEPMPPLTQPLTDYDTILPALT